MDSGTSQPPPSPADAQATWPEQRTAVVTGAGSPRGIGRALVTRLAGQGWAVALLDLDAAAAVAQVEQALPPVVAVANLAGIASPTPFFETTADGWDRVMAVNARGVFLVTQAFARGMVDRRLGRVVSASSVSAQRGGGTYSKSACSASEAAIIGFTRAAAREIRPLGVTVNAVAPGPVGTDIMGGPLDETRRAAMSGDSLVGRAGTVDDVTALMAHLTGPDAGYVTAAVYDVKRGHVHAEIAELGAALLAHDGVHADAVLFVPAYLEAGRVTAGGTHRAKVSGRWLPVGESEFARDATSGYSSSDLRDFLAERSSGSLVADDVARVDLAVLAAQERGHRLLFRTGPSFVLALAGIDVREPLNADELAALGAGGRHGLVVAGSHTALASRQVDALVDLGGVERVELDVAALVEPRRRDDEVARAAERSTTALEGSDVLLLTSRDLVRGEDGASSLAIARTVSAAVVGQLLPGAVSVLSPVQAPPEVLGVPYVVFAGNVGDDASLATAVTALRGRG